jgi:hypothetical protein
MHFRSQKVKIKFNFSWDARGGTGSWLIRDIFVDRTKSSTAGGSNFLIYPVEVRYKYKGDRSTDPDIPPKVQVYLRYNGSNFVAKLNVNGMYHSNYTDYGLSFPSSIFTTDGDTTDASVDTVTTYDINTGNVGIGTTNPRATLDINSTDSIIIPSGTEAQRNGTPVTGMIRFNTSKNAIEHYNGTSWKLLTVFNSGSGGNDTFTLNGYRVHVFTSGGTFTANGDIDNLDVLMVGGGGGGGSDNGAGGGAGGLIFRPNSYITNGDYTIQIGTPGTGTPGPGTTSGKGGSTTAFGLTAVGGGYGNNGNAGDGTSNNGGSGGGGDGERPTTGGSGTQPTQSGDSGTYGYGNDGGNGASGGDNGAGGGGGAGTDGGNGTSTLGGTGGDGLNEVTVGGNVYNFATIFGTDYGEIISGQAWFAGGGAGGNDNNNGTSVAGGKGGGGSTANHIPDDGTTNTGGGGGGSTYNNSFPAGGDGGSGIVIIRYPL